MQLVPLALRQLLERCRLALHRKAFRLDLQATHFRELESSLQEGILEQAAHVQFPQQDFLVVRDEPVLTLHLLVYSRQLVLDLNLTGTHLLHPFLQVVYFLLKLNYLVFLLVENAGVVQCPGPLNP